MPHYFFHIRTAGDLVKDEEGLILRNLVEAREEAISSARDIVTECLRAESPIAVGNAVEVGDEGGAVVLIVPFTEAISVAENDSTS